MKQFLISLLITMVVAGLFLLIPDSYSTAYPPNTPLPPIIVTPDATPAMPTYPWPLWYYIDCGDDPLHVEIWWDSPPDHAQPFSYTYSYVWVQWGEGNYQDYQMLYQGELFPDEFFWFGNFPMPDTRIFDISGVIVGGNPQQNWYTEPMWLHLDCRNKQYLPMVAFQ